MKNIFIISILLVSSIFISCKKGPGEGGRASIKGKVKVRSYNKEYTIMKSEYYVPGEKVYISYGENPVTTNDVRTAADGSFEFSYLRPGKYKVFVVSKDTTTAELSGLTAVTQETEIKSKKQSIQLDEFIIID